MLKVEKSITEIIKIGKVSEEIKPLIDNIILDDIKYKPEEIILQKLGNCMTKCAERIEVKICVYLTEVQKINKRLAMLFIHDINVYLKVFLTLKK